MHRCFLSDFFRDCNPFQVAAATLHVVRESDTDFAVIKRVNVRSIIGQNWRYSGTNNDIKMT